MKTNSLPVLDIIYKSIAYPIYLRKKLVVTLLPIFCILFALDMISEYVSRVVDPGSSGILFDLLAVPLAIIFTITIHRIMILGPDSTPKSGIFGWGSREWRFLILSIGLTLTVFLLTLTPIYFFPYLVFQGDFYKYVMWLVFLPAVILFCRLLLVFPATAIDSDFTFIQSCRMSRGNTIRLCLVISAFPFVGIIFFMALYKILPEVVVTHFEIPLTLVSLLIGYVLWVVEIACLSFSYKYLMNNPPEF